MNGKKIMRGLERGRKGGGEEEEEEEEEGDGEKGVGVVSEFSW